MTREQAEGIIKALLSLREDATDAQASKAVCLYPTLKQNGALVKTGTRINWNDTLKRAAVDLWDTAENNPDNAPALWVGLDYKDGYRIIPEVITVSLAFAKGECGWWNGVLYRSKVDANVYNPSVYAANWEVVQQ